MSTINIAAGQSSKRQHLRNGAGTACNRRTSGINCHDFEGFKWWAEKYPEDCCQKCLNRFNERMNRLQSRK